MSTEKDVIISARGLKKSFGTGDSQQVIFENLNLDIYRGDFTIIMGSSGAGKSTLMYSLSGMDRPTAGTVHFAGKEITK
ncbi:MAG: ATP-binding cassette domain-containing protein [Clostridia bacterium]|nr:ATP-binding cassette domain-containing protein [Clostridia bacterium]